MAACVPGADAAPEVSNVSAAQRQGTTLVDIDYDVENAGGGLLTIRLEASDDNGRTWTVPSVTLAGDAGEGVEPGPGKRIVWDAGADWGGEYSDNMRVKVIATAADGFPGVEWSDEIPPGGFLMGQDGGAEGVGPSRHVNIPWSYWLSKNEITVGQFCDFLNLAHSLGKLWRCGYASVWAAEGSGMVDGAGFAVPLAPIGDSCDIRWNAIRYEVVGGRTNYPAMVTWYGAKAFARMYGCGLPSDAEWERAARGPSNEEFGEHLLYPWGNDISSGQANINQPPVPVGQYPATAYGLYDLIGNAPEWTDSEYCEDLEFQENYDPCDIAWDAAFPDDPCMPVAVRGGRSGGRVFEKSRGDKVSTALLCRTSTLTITQSFSEGFEIGANGARSFAGSFHHVGTGRLIPSSVHIQLGTYGFVGDDFGRLVGSGGTGSFNQFRWSITLNSPILRDIEAVWSYSVDKMMPVRQYFTGDVWWNSIETNTMAWSMVTTWVSSSNRTAFSGLFSIPSSSSDSVADADAFNSSVGQPEIRRGSVSVAIQSSDGVEYLFFDDGNGNLRSPSGEGMYDRAKWTVELKHPQNGIVTADVDYEVNVPFLSYSGSASPWEDPGAIDFNSLNGFRIVRRAGEGLTEEASIPEEVNAFSGE